MTAFSYDAYVAAAHFDGASQAWFALGDGTVRGPGLPDRRTHAGAVLCAALHPSGSGLLTGGDDGAVCWTRPGETTTLFERPGRWIDALDASAANGLVAFACGREAHVRDVADARFERLFRHERSVAALAFDPKGRRLAAASYGGVLLWYARIAEQKPQALKWAGSHIGLAWSPDARFVVSSMQENALHGWRLADGKDMRMGGYPAKVRSLAFLSKGRLMASSGAPAAVVWPFAGADGPMGKEAAEIGFQEGSEVCRVAAEAGGSRLAGGRTDGSVWVADLAAQGVREIVPPAGSPVSALAMSPDGTQLAFGDEAGGAGVIVL
ncbi:WD40 repeat domain-containing protein [Caulobacter sp. S45]|uniref:WD40 repeat domain-containing protein n=1 Tax=Caulobacter sp. S45 TaxID=1641861 RepID=UPI001575E0CC|nr:WD40 repeat domain-containing protein [Caulobacter sp. S45]